MHEHLVILPHPRLVPPSITQPIKFIRVPSADYLLGLQLLHQTVQVGAILVKIDALVVSSAVVEGRQEERSRQRRQSATPLSELWERVDRSIDSVLDNANFAQLVALESTPSFAKNESSVR